MSDLQYLRNPGVSLLVRPPRPALFHGRAYGAEKAVNDILKEEQRENIFV
jgi:hypothetical protein